MLNTFESADSSTRPRESGVEIVDNSRTGHDERCKFDGRETGNNEINDEVNNEVDNKIGKKGQKTSKSKNSFKKLFKSKKTVKSDFFTLRAKLAFTKLRQMFIKAPIFHHLDPKRHIRVETNASGYAICQIFSQLAWDNSDQWNPIAFFLQKMTPAETRYKTYDGELLAIVEAFIN